MLKTNIRELVHARWFWFPPIFDRRTEKEGSDGMMVTAVRPYIMDLGSTNGTFLNGERLESQRYYELLEQDMIRVGNSSREYVLLHDKSRGT